MRSSSRLLLILLSVLLISGAALANTCDDFAAYTCLKSTPNIVNFNGTGSTGQSVGILLGGNTFSISLNGKSAAGYDLVIMAAFPNGMAGSVNGVSFTALSSFGEDGAIALNKNNQWTGAIPDTWNGLGIVYKSVSFGYANLGTIGNGPISVTAANVPKGTILYAEIINPKTGKILYLTPNSEAGLMGQISTVPEPASLILIGTGLLGMAAHFRRKMRR